MLLSIVASVRYKVSFFLLCKNTEQILMKFAGGSHYHEHIK